MGFRRSKVRILSPRPTTWVRKSPLRGSDRRGDHLSVTRAVTLSRSAEHAIHAIRQPLSHRIGEVLRGPPATRLGVAIAGREPGGITMPARNTWRTRGVRLPWSPFGPVVLPEFTSPNAIAGAELGPHAPGGAPSHRKLVRRYRRPASSLHERTGIMHTVGNRSRMHSGTVASHRTRPASRRQYGLMMAAVVTAAAMLYLLGSIEVVLGG
jgi:hypothetical protein